MMVVGLTGGLATGKSLAAEAFRRLGAAVLSADQIAREVTAAGTPAVRRIADELGEEFVRPDGSLDRSALGEYVFRNAEARRRLEAIVHPPVLERLRQEIERYRNLGGSPEVLVVEVPLLYEVGIADWFDKVVVVAAPEKAQVARVMARERVSQEEALRRVQAQMPLELKMQRADVVIRNEGAPEDLEEAVQRTFESLRRGRENTASQGSRKDKCAGACT